MHLGLHGIHSQSGGDIKRGQICTVLGLKEQPHAEPVRQVRVQRTLRRHSVRRHLTCEPLGETVPPANPAALRSAVKNGTPPSECKSVR